MQFEIQILGSNASQPFRNRMLPALVVRWQDHLYLIDCGEGTQMQMIRYKVKRNRIRSIFISHLHGDHFFGLPGLITSYNHFGRSKKLRVFGPKPLARILRDTLKAGDVQPGFDLQINEFDPAKNEKIYEDMGLEVLTFPLTHRIPTAGFLFREKPRPPGIRPEAIERYEIPYELIESIRDGAGYQTPAGELIPHEKLTLPPPPVRSFAYCSDTAYSQEYISEIKGVNLLYHEATFDDSLQDKAIRTGHSTASDAARAARGAGAQRLIIGHFSSRYDDPGALRREAVRIFPETELAEDGKVYDI